MILHPCTAAWGLAKANFFWLLPAQLTPGLKDCYNEKLGLSIMKVVVGVSLQVLCSYITFPLYALVTQVILFVKNNHL